MKNKIFAMFDYLLILVIFSLITLGIMFIYSSSVNSSGVSVNIEYIKQIIWAGIGLVIMIIITIYDYRKLERFSFYLYIILVGLLVFTLIFGKNVNGARSWIGGRHFGIQPSEFGKSFFILFLAKFLKDTNNINSQTKRFFLSILILFVPLALILVQPDMGTGSVYIPIFLVMCFMAGIPLRYLIFILSYGVLTIFLTILPVWNSHIASNPVAAINVLTNMRLLMILIAATALIAVLGFVIRRYFHGPSYIFWISYVFSIITLSLVSSIFLGKFLKDYQIMRLIIFMNPNKDRLGAGWNIIQSKIAIGAGGIWGKGYLNGTQSHYRFLPQQSTDFIFSILSEEFGFIGGLVVFGLYTIIFVKLLILIKLCSNKFGVYIVSGILAMFVFHFFINIGMVMGIMPITGIPLLFLSYGGSSLLNSMTCMGLVMSISYRRKDLM